MNTLGCPLVGGRARDPPWPSADGKARDLTRCLRAIALKGAGKRGSRHSSGARDQGGPVPRTGFDPCAHGFHFANDFVDKVVTVPGYGEVATDGRSGGMAFAALDYWFAGLPVPSHRPDDFPDRAVPEDGTRLADFIHKRLFDSYATWSARQFLTWSLAEDHPTWSSPGVARLTADELPRVRRSIGAGRLGVRGLDGALPLEEVRAIRQVVAYGYDDDGP